jgi:hypothetical protein
VSRIGFFVLALAVAAVELGCSTGDSAKPEPIAACTQLDVPDGGPLKVTGRVVEKAHDGGTPQPIPNAMVSVEYGGLYVPYCNRALASPYYVFGTYTDAQGNFTIDVKHGALLGFHSFATGYYYSRAPLDTTAGTDVTIETERLPDAQAKPIVANAGFVQSTVLLGDRVTFTAEVRAASPNDPLSDEILLVEPTRSWSVELNPPSVGKPDSFPDGLWKRSFLSPLKGGTYTYYFSATTAGCVTSDVQTFTLTVQ